MIRNMVENGMKISDMAKELNIDRKKVKKYAKSRTVPKHKQRKKRSLKLDPYTDYMSGEEALEILGNIHVVGSLYENRKMECNLNEVDRDAGQMMDILKLKPFFHKIVGNTKNIK